MEERVPEMAPMEGVTAQGLTDQLLEEENMQLEEEGAALEAEIREAIRRPVGATTIDGVKRRTRAGMGRCQGGFCSPRVLEILAEELNLDPTEITKCGGKSNLLVGTIAEAAGKENA